MKNMPKDDSGNISGLDDVRLQQRTEGASDILPHSVYRATDVVQNQLRSVIVPDIDQDDTHFPVDIDIADDFAGK